MKSVIKNITAALIICILTLSAYNAQALVVESAGQAMNRNMFEPGFVPGRATKANSVSKKNSSSSRLVTTNKTADKQNDAYDTKRDYSKDIASKLLNTADDGALVLVDMIDHYRASLTLSKGQFLAVRLTEDSDEKWNFENRSNGLQFVKREKRGDIVILLYKAVAAGGNRVNLDKLSDTSPAQALEAKVLQVRVI